MVSRIQESSLRRAVVMFHEKGKAKRNGNQVWNDGAKSADIKVNSSRLHLRLPNGLRSAGCDLWELWVQVFIS